MKEPLNDLRAKIDEIDLKLLELLNQRAEYATEIATVKQRDDDSATNYYRPERQFQLLSRLIESNSGPLSDTHVRGLFRQIMSVCLWLQQKLTVAFLGPSGTYTEAAVANRFGDFVDRLSTVSILDTFNAVSNGSAQYGVVPVENSTEGMVNQTLDCFIESNLRICGEVVLPIHHMLVTNERTDVASIEVIAAHEQALAQCRTWIVANYPQAELKPVSSNGEAVRLIQESDGMAAIAGEFAAKLFSLRIVARNIEDRSDNTTRFLVLGEQQIEPCGDDKTTIIVSTHNEPGALLKVLEPFASRSISLSRIETRPSKTEVWSYVFFVDFDGHESDPNIKSVLEEVRAVSTNVRSLGSYPKGTRLAVKNVNQNVRNLQPYQPGTSLDILFREYGIDDGIKLASNENPRGPSEKVKEAIRGDLSELSRYPDSGGFDLKRLLAERLCVLPEQITLGNGSNDVLELAARVAISPGSNAIVDEHCFVVYPLAIIGAQGEVRKIPSHQWGHDLVSMAAAIDTDTRAVFIANPNNPTGTWVNSHDLRSFLNAVPRDIWVILDEAYFEYAQREETYPDGTTLITDFPNLVVTRTFSKVYGLAGLRVGYSVSSPEFADLMNRVRQPFNVNSLALASAEVAIQDEEYVVESVRMNIEGMDFLSSALLDLSLEFIPSMGNFITIDLGHDASPVYQALLQRGVIVRPIASYSMPKHLRVTVGQPLENQRFLQALESSL